MGLDEYSIRATGPLDYINRFCSNLNVPRNIFHICEYVTVKAYQLDIVDPDNESFTYELANAPVGMIVTPSGLITWTPGAM